MRYTSLFLRRLARAALCLLCFLSLQAQAKGASYTGQIVGAGESAYLSKSLGSSDDGESGADGLGMLGDYLQMVRSQISANWSFPAQRKRGQYSTLVNVRIAPDGTITQVRKLRSSGDPFFDASIENALARTAKLEPPPRPNLTNIDIEFAF